MIVVGIGELLRILQDLPHAGHQLVQKLTALRVVEQRSAHARNLNEAGERQRRQACRQRKVEVEEELKRGVLEKGGPPRGGYLNGAEVVRGLVRGGPDEVKGETIEGEAEQLGQQAVLGGIVEVQIFLLINTMNH